MKEKITIMESFNTEGKMMSSIKKKSKKSDYFCIPPWDFMIVCILSGMDFTNLKQHSPLV